MIRRYLHAAVVTLVGATLAANCTHSLGESFRPLFDGETLDGWAVVGGEATYRVEKAPQGGFEVVGTTRVDTPNTFLRTETEYGDFVLEFEVKVDPTVNSGVQFRSAVYPAETKTQVRSAAGEVAAAAQPQGRVHGYQAEIDPSPRGWAGGIYDEAGRGWIAPLDKPEHAAARKAFDPAGWNHYRIEARGNHLRTFVNDVPCADVIDDALAKGFVALQVHSIDGPAQAGKEIRWRNVQIAVAE
ncbi:MAG: 3-keto-disaccharide hydrolase [Lacipirellulaceae bacterium]